MSNAKGPTRRTVLQVRDACLSLHLQRAARAVARRFDEAFRPLGLTSGQFSLLMALTRPEPWKLGQLASVLAMDRTTLTANLKPLERHGLAAVAVDPEDRRAKRLTITPEGRALLAEAYPVWRKVQKQIEAQLAAGTADEVRKALVAMS